MLKSSGGQLPCMDDPQEAAPLPVVEVEERPEAEDRTAEEDEPVESLPLPPGPVGDFASIIMQMSRYPFHPFATLGALVGFATVAARKVRYENLYPSLFGFMLAESSNGKEDTQRCVEEALLASGLDRNHVISRITGYNSAIEAMMRVWYHPVLFAGVDEGAGFLVAARKGEYGLQDFLKEVWTKCGRWQHPWKRKTHGGTVNLQSVYHPALNILLATQPSAMGSASDFAAIQDGLLPRCVWVVRKDWAMVPNREAPNHVDDLRVTPDGQAIVARMRELWDWMSPKRERMPTVKYRFKNMYAASEYFRVEFKHVVGDGEKEGLWPQAVQFGASPEVQAAFDEFEVECRKNGAPGRGKQAMLAGLWGKATENAKRVALTLAAARCGADPDVCKIELVEAQWAIRFIRATVFSGIRWGREHLFESPFQAQCEKVFSIIDEAGAGIQQQDLTRRLQHRFRAKEIIEVTATLVLEGRIERVSIQTKGRTANGWRAVRRSPEK